MEITKNLSGACFKNYRELCAETGLPLTNGKSKRCQFNKLQQEYDITFKGQKIIFGKKKEAPHFNKEYREEQQDYKKALDILNKPQRNNQYISNNLLLFLHYLKTNEDNRYGTYTVRQMREFGFLRAGLRPDYLNKQEDYLGRGPLFNIDKNFEENINEQLRELSIAKDCQDVFREIFGFLRDRYGKIMDISCSKFVNEESIATFGSWITKAQWEYFKQHYNESLNLMRRDMEMVGIITDEEGNFVEERILTSKETDTYFIIRNRIMEQEHISRLNYEEMSRSQSRVFSRISKECKEILGFGVTYRKLYYSPLKELDAFIITEEDVNNAKFDNNEKMRNTLKSHFKKKYFLTKKVVELYEKCINYITDIKIVL